MHYDSASVHYVVSSENAKDAQEEDASHLSYAIQEREEETAIQKKEISGTTKLLFVELGADVT